MTKSKGFAFVGTLLCSAASLPALAQQAPMNSAENCETETVQKMAPADTTVTFAWRENDALCRVIGSVTTNNPGLNNVLFTLGLLNPFSGRYFYLGVVGGAARYVPRLQPDLLVKGYAVGGSDGGSGTKNSADFSFRSYPCWQADFTGRGVHVVAKQRRRSPGPTTPYQTIERQRRICLAPEELTITN